MLRYTRFDSPLWEIVLVGDKRGLASLHLVTSQGKRKVIIDKSWKRDDDIFTEARQQVLEYINGTRTEFTIPLNPQGTDFQKQVWRALRSIPYGEVRTYKEIAVLIGKPTAARAVGMANSKNPIPLIVPCHRVIGSNGRLTGFAYGLKVKARLLDMERPGQQNVR